MTTPSIRLMAIALGSIVIASGTANAQVVKNGGASGTVQSFSKLVPASSVQELFTTDATNHFIVTSVCVEGPVAVRAGDLHLTNPQGASGVQACTSFPGGGVALEQSVAVDCANFGSPNAGFCMVTGVLSKR